MAQALTHRSPSVNRGTSFHTAVPRFARTLEVLVDSSTWARPVARLQIRPQSFGLVRPTPRFTSGRYRQAYNINDHIAGIDLEIVASRSDPAHDKDANLVGDRGRYSFTLTSEFDCDARDCVEP